MNLNVLFGFTKCTFFLLCIYDLRIRSARYGDFVFLKRIAIIPYGTESNNRPVDSRIIVSDFGSYMIFKTYDVCVSLYIKIRFSPRRRCTRPATRVYGNCYQ